MISKRKTLVFLLITFALALSLVIPATASTILPTRFVPGDDLVGPAAGDQITPRIASGGTTYLAVWADKRSILTGLGNFDFETSTDIYAIRLDALGNPIEPTPFPITTGPGSQENPQVVWNGTNWLVVYESYRLNGTGYYYEKSLEAVRVSTDGQLLDPTPIKIFNIVPDTGMWSVASDGSNWMLAFQGVAASNDLMALRISADGVVLDPPVHTLVPATYYLRFHLRLVYANGVYLLTWAEPDTMGIRFDQDFNVLDAGPIPLVSGFPLADIKSNGSQFYAVWNAQDPWNYQITVTGSRISTDGVMLDGSGVDISQANKPAPDTTTSVVWDGTNWKAIWSYQGASIARIAPDGQVLEPGGIAFGGLNSGPAASNPSGSVEIVWSTFGQPLVNTYDVLSAAVSNGDVASPVIPLSTGAPDQLRPDVAVGNNGYMIVYRSDISGMDRIMAQPLDTTGNPLTTEPIQLGSGDTFNGPDTPAVAWNGSLYMVTWSINNQVLALRIQQDGAIVDANPIVVMTGTGLTDVAAVGNVFLVTGRYIVNSYPELIYPIAARVDGTDGSVLDPSPLVVGSSYTRYIAVTAMNNQWLVVWQENFSHDDPLAATAGAFVNPDGTFTTSFTIYGIYTTGIYSYGPSVASNGSTALVVQNAEISSGVEMDLAGQIVNADGSLGTTITMTPWEGNQYRPRVAWDGSNFIVAYQDQRNRLAEWELDQLDARSDLFGMRVGVDGSIVDPQGFLFSNSTDAEAYPNVAAANGVSLITASIMRLAPYIAYRVGYEQLGTGGNPWPVALASASPSAGNIPLLVSFSSAGSTDPDGNITAYSWDFGDGVSSSIANPTHTYTSGGPFVATLTVTDNQGAQSTTTVLVKALKPNILPIANVSPDKISGPAPLDVTFFATGSYDPDGSLGNFRWDFSDGNQYWGATAYNTFYTDGVYTAQLTVYDNSGGSAFETITITVTSSNIAPILAPIGNKSVFELDTLTFTATASDADLPPQSLTFSLGGNAPDGASITPEGLFSWTPTEQQGPGQYPITVIVTDNGQPALSDSETIQVNVQEVGLNPIVDAGPDQAADEAQSVQFSGSFTNPGLLLAGELIHWDFGDGSTLTGTLTPAHSFGDNGNFTVTLTINDGMGGVGSDWLVVTVNNIAPILTPISDQAIMIGTPLTIEAVITDPGWLDTNTIVINWGDGSTETINLPAGELALDLAHTYTTVGKFIATLNVQDDDGGIDSQTFETTVSYWQMLPIVHR